MASMVAIGEEFGDDNSAKREDERSVVQSGSGSAIQVRTKS